MDLQLAQIAKEVKGDDFQEIYQFLPVQTIFNGFSFYVNRDRISLLKWKFYFELSVYMTIRWL